MLLAFDDDFVSASWMLIHTSSHGLWIHIDAKVMLVRWIHSLAYVWIPIQCIELVDVDIDSYCAVFRHSNFRRSLGDPRLLFLLLDRSLRRIDSLSVNFLIVHQIVFLTLSLARDLDSVTLAVLELI